MNQPQPPGTAASFSIDLARAPQAIKDLERARIQLEELKQEAVQLGRVVPPAQDQVSLDAAAALSAAAVGGPGSLVQALDAGIVHVRGLLDALSREVERYSSTEAGNAAVIKS